MRTSITYLSTRYCKSEFVNSVFLFFFIQQRKSEKIDLKRNLTFFFNTFTLYFSITLCLDYILYKNWFQVSCPSQLTFSILKKMQKSLTLHCQKKKWSAYLDCILKLIIVGIRPWLYE